MSDAAPEIPEGARDYRVLIVDDNRDAANTLAMLARLWGYDVQTAYDGRTGLEKARSFRPDCVVLDIGLPGIDGYTLAHHLRQHPVLNSAKLIALSAYSSEEHGRRIHDAGFDYHFVKPADPTILEGVLKMLEHAMKLMERTEALAQQNMDLARETKELLSEVKEDIAEVKDELREVKDELREVKEELHGTDE
jgi:two-component system OmpR family response regulator